MRNIFLFYSAVLISMGFFGCDGNTTLPAHRYILLDE